MKGLDKVTGRTSFSKAAAAAKAALDDTERQTAKLRAIFDEARRVTLGKAKRIIAKSKDTARKKTHKFVGKAKTTNRRRKAPGG